MSWDLVIEFGHGYSGEVITHEPGKLRIALSFASESSARYAMNEMTVTVEREKPAVIQGEVVPSPGSLSARRQPPALR